MSIKKNLNNQFGVQEARETPLPATRSTLPAVPTEPSTAKKVLDPSTIVNVYILFELKSQ